MGHQVDQRSVSAAAGDGPTKGQRTKAQLHPNPKRPGQTWQWRDSSISCHDFGEPPSVWRKFYDVTMFPLKSERFFPLTMEIAANLSPENVTGVLLNRKYILKFVKDTNEHIQFLGGCRIFRGCHV